MENSNERWPEVATEGILKKVFLKISQNSEENKHLYQSLFF